MKGVGKSITKSFRETTSSPYKHVPVGACGLVTHCPFKQLLPESHIVPFIAPACDPLGMTILSVILIKYKMDVPKL
jgi:hypothetical protein